MEVITRELSAGGKASNTPGKIIVHSMAEYILDPNPQHAADFLEGYGLSAHALINAEGVVYVCRKDTQRAYHARGHNKNSLGVEFLVPGEHNYASFIEAIKQPGWVSDEQLDAGITWVGNWIRSWDIDIGTVMRHSDVSPGRKVDPGEGFPWDHFLEKLLEES